MNLILFEADAVQSDGTVCLTGACAQHLRDVLHAVPGQRIKTGVVDGAMGYSRVLTLSDNEVRLLPEHTLCAPEPSFDLILAVPRPKALKRLWPQLAAMGAGQIVLLNAYRVEKCYFSSHWLEPVFYRELLLEGLMQAGLTRMPAVRVCPRFKPFVEDELDAVFPTASRWLAHPGPLCRLEHEPSAGGRPLLAVGPEGGWTDYELGMLEARDFQRFSLGAHTLRTDTACVALIAILAYYKHVVIGIK